MPIAITAESIPALVRLGPIACRLGMSADLLEAAANRGDLPVRVLRLGARGDRFLRRVDLPELERISGVSLSTNL